MVNTANVYLWGEFVGSIHWYENRLSAEFEYADDFIGKGLPVSPITMPLKSNERYRFNNINRDTFMGLPGLLADALPDAFGKALLEKWLASQQRTFANPVERLCYQGKRSMGALEFEPAMDNFLEEGAVLEISSLVEIASEILDERKSFATNLKSDTKEALVNIIRVGTSAGGQRAKAVIAYNEKTGEVRSGQIEALEGFAHWLIKLDGVSNTGLGDPKHYGQIEYVYHLMACASGIEMSECRLLEENGRSHFMTRRFDREGNEKIHMQTLCGLAHYDYKMPLAYSYEQAFMVMRQLRLGMPQMEQLFRRMVFNVVARNQDDHTKNISFLMNRKGEWRLSPAYDMSWAYNPGGGWTARHQMTVRNKSENITDADMLALADDISLKHAKEIIAQVKDAVAQWPSLAKRHGIPADMIKRIDGALLYRG